MARLLFDGVLFEPVAPNAIPVQDYSRLVMESAAVLYPNYIPVTFELPIKNPRGSARPHLALIDSTYRDWWLVVLETGDPPTLDYVTKQVEVLRAGKYSEYPKTLVEQNNKLDLARVSNLMRREAPRVFILAGQPPPPALKDDSACVGIAEVFEDSLTHRRILRINGEHPTAPPEMLSFCRRHLMVPAVILELESPDKVPQWPRDESEIEIGDVVTIWRRTEESITPVSACSLPSGARFRLVRMPSGMLRITPA